MRTRFAQLAAAAMVATAMATVTVPLATAADEPSKTGVAAADATIKSFLGTYCTQCHGAATQKGERRWDQLSLPVGNADTLLDLQDILDQLNLGEMPPKKAKQPGEGELRQAIDLLTEAVAGARAKFSSTGGQTVLRRLNRREYLNTVGDLFALNMTLFDPTAKFPGDQVVMHMDNNGDALRTSGYLLDQYLDAADQVVEKAFRAQQRTPEQTWTFNDNFHQQQEIFNRYGSVNLRYLRLYEGPSSPRHIGAYAPRCCRQGGWSDREGPARPGISARMHRSWTSLRVCRPTDSMKSRCGQRRSPVAHVQGLARRRIHPAFHLAQWHDGGRHPDDREGQQAAAGEKDTARSDSRGARSRPA